MITVITATTMSLFISAIIRQSEERKRLIAELEATRQELAAKERRAGMLEERRVWRAKSTTPLRRVLSAS
ncbi:MAG: hypothetical protein WKH64_01615 [Chloroflexia bacterium]